METILIINNHQETGHQLDKLLTQKGFQTRRYQTGKEALRWLNRNRAELALCACELPDMNGHEVLHAFRKLDYKLPVILIAENGNIRDATRACKSGAFDYVSMPLYPDEILSTITEALSENIRGKDKEHQFIEGTSPQFQQIVKDIQLVGKTNISVNISGETGTGKEYVAREIHYQSNRRKGPFKAIDCGTLTNDLAGSELFGHTRGSFTGAVEDKKGWFELANKGTLFLDEICNLSQENQIKLLRALQDKEIRKLGSSQDISVDVRVLTASNEDLEGLVEAGRFRKDLFYRLNEFEIYLPPLKERPGDIIVFAEHFLILANQQLDKHIRGFSDKAMGRLQRHDWPGNLRELKNMVKRVVLQCNEPLIDEQHLPCGLISRQKTDSMSLVNLIFKKEMPSSLNTLVEEVEQLTIKEILQRTGNNKAETARILNIDRKTLYNKMNAYKISY